MLGEKKVVRRERKASSISPKESTVESRYGKETCGLLVRKRVLALVGEEGGSGFVTTRKGEGSWRGAFSKKVTTRLPGRRRSSRWRGAAFSFFDNPKARVPRRNESFLGFPERTAYFTGDHDKRYRSETAGPAHNEGSWCQTRLGEGIRSPQRTEIPRP